jgi:putative DNA primase/helicase
MVQATRKSPDTRCHHAGLALPSPETWDEPVDGAKLLTGLAEAFRRYVVMEDGAAEALALWIVHAHALDAFVFSPRMAITSAEKRCGKTTLLDVLGCLVPRPLPTANATAPAIFRSIELLGPTLLIDEADTFLRSNDELRGVLNSGHRRATARVIRLVGDDHQPCQFHTWAATAIAMIGGLPDTLADRSIEIRLRRRLPGEPVSRFRADRASDLAQLGRMAARWARDHLEALRNADPPIPAGLNDRAADNWTPLLTIADLAGGEWPEHSRRAIASMTFRAGDEAGSLGELLLADIRQAFAEIERRHTTPTGDHFTDSDRIRSRDLAGMLRDMEGRPWAEWGPQRLPLSANGLARLLKPFGIRPATLRLHEKAGAGTTLASPTRAISEASSKTPSPDTYRLRHPWIQPSHRHNPRKSANPSPIPNRNSNRHAPCEVVTVGPVRDTVTPCVTVCVTLHSGAHPAESGHCDGVTVGNPPVRKPLWGTSRRRIQCPSRADP